MGAYREMYGGKRMSMTYNTLVQEVKDTLDRYDELFASYIPKFILRAHHRISREAKSIGLVLSDTRRFTPTVNTYQKPARWRGKRMSKVISMDGFVVKKIQEISKKIEEKPLDSNIENRQYLTDVLNKLYVLLDKLNRM